MTRTAPKNINKKAQFLVGIGASAWFYIFQEKSKYVIERYSEKGVLECSRVFRLVNKGVGHSHNILLSPLSLKQH